MSFFKKITSIISQNIRKRKSDISGYKSYLYPSKVYLIFNAQARKSKFKCEKCDILKAHDTKIILNANTPLPTRKKMLACTRWGLSRWRVPLEKPGIASLRKKVENLDKAVHFQRGLRAILYKFDLRNIKKNLNRLYTCSAFSRPVKRSLNQVLDLDTVKKKCTIHT